MTLLQEIPNALSHFLFPHICCGCGTDILPRNSNLCYRCLGSLPETGFEQIRANPAEKIFWGRIPLFSASAHYFFARDSLIQHLMHQVKYRNNQDLALQLGKLMGERLAGLERFPIDAMVPLPLFPAKERKRGYNQSTLLCRGMQDILKVPILENVVARPEHTETQTKKGRIARWENMEGKFQLIDPSAARNRHLLLVDDVITTGATLESCGNTLLEAGNVTLSVASLCLAAR